MCLAVSQVSLNQEHLILSTAKLERNSTTLLFTVAELEAIRERERKARGALVERGVRQTTFEIFSGGQSRDLGSGNIFQQRLTAKMHINHMARGGGGRMGGPMDRAGAAGAIPEVTPRLCLGICAWGYADTGHLSRSLCRLGQRGRTFQPSTLREAR